MSKQTAVKLIHGNTIEYWRANAEENYMTTPISVLRYITILEEQAKAMEREQRFQDFKEGFQAAFDSLQGANNLVQSKTYKGGEQ